MQLLAKFKKILYMGFRATLNFPRFQGSTANSLFTRHMASHRQSQLRRQFAHSRLSAMATIIWNRVWIVLNRYSETYTLFDPCLTSAACSGSKFKFRTKTISVFLWKAAIKFEHFLIGVLFMSPKRFCKSFERFWRHCTDCSFQRKHVDSLNFKSI